MAAIFLSYSREDRTSVERIARVLHRAGHDVWWDRHISSGSEFAAEIETQLAKADLVLVVWSASAAKSPWVRDEAGIGRDKGRLLPVVVDGTLPPIGFRQFQALDLASWKGRENDRRTKALVDAVGTVLSGKALDSSPRPAGQTALRGKRLWAFAAAFLLMVAAITGYFLLNRDKSSSQLSKPTIALLPFATVSADPELRQIAAQSRESIAHTFSDSGLPVRLLGSAPKQGDPPVDFLIAGDFSRNGDKILASIRLDEAAHGVTVYSRRFETSGEDIRHLAERIGAQVAGNLATAPTLKAMDRRRPLDPALLADLLDDDFETDPLEAYQKNRRAAAKAPDVAITQTGLAFSTAFVLDGIPRSERPQAVAEARRAADRAMKLDPGFGDTFATWCLLRSETLMAECEDRLRAGRRVDPDAPYLNTFLGHLLRHVGRFEETMDLARLAHTHDIYVPTKIAWMLRMLEYDGDGDEARELHKQGTRWWPEYAPMFFRNRLFGLINRGDFEAMQRLEQEVGAKGLPPGYATSGAVVAALRAKSIPALKRSCPDAAGELLHLRCMIAFAILGDQDSAYAIVEKYYPRRVGRTPAETERIWLDNPSGAGGLEFVTSRGAAPLRRDPRYLAVAQRVGLLDYWRSGRLPDFCRKDPEPVCRALKAKSQSPLLNN